MEEIGREEEGEEVHCHICLKTVEEKNMKFWKFKCNSTSCKFFFFVICLIALMAR